MTVIHLKKDSFPNPHYGITYCGRLIRNPYLPWSTTVPPGVGYTHAVSLGDIDKVSCDMCRKTVFPDPRTLWQRGSTPPLTWTTFGGQWVTQLTSREIEIRLAYLQTLPQPLDAHDAMAQLLLTWVIHSCRLDMAVDDTQPKPTHPI